MLTFTFFGRYTQFEIYCTQSSFGDELASQLSVRFIMSVAQPKRRCFVTMCLAGSFGKRYMAIRCLPSSSVSEVFVCEITFYCQLHCSRLCFSLRIFETNYKKTDWLPVSHYLICRLFADFVPFLSMMVNN